MTRKRFIKLMRSHGFSNRFINENVKAVKSRRVSSYESAYHSLDNMISSLKALRMVIQKSKLSGK